MRSEESVVAFIGTISQILPGKTEENLVKYSMESRYYGPN
jgi:hypothetical protein